MHFVVLADARKYTLIQTETVFCFGLKIYVVLLQSSRFALVSFNVK